MSQPCKCLVLRVGLNQLIRYRWTWCLGRNAHHSAICQKRVRSVPGVEPKQMCWTVRFKSTSWCLTRCWKCGPARSKSKSSRLQLQRSWTDTENSYFKKCHIFFLSIMPQFHFSTTLAMRWVCVCTAKCRAWVMRSSGGSVGRCCLNVSSCANWCDPHLISHVFHCGWGSGRSLCALARNWATYTQQQHH